MSNEKILERARQLREGIVSKRARLETELTEMKTNLSKLSAESLSKIGFNLEDLNSRKLFPSLYESEFNPEAYEKEVANYSSMTISLIKLRKEKMEEFEAFENAQR